MSAASARSARITVPLITPLILQFQIALQFRIGDTAGGRRPTTRRRQLARKRRLCLYVVARIRAAARKRQHRVRRDVNTSPQPDEPMTEQQQIFLAMAVVCAIAGGALLWAFLL